MKRNMDDMVSQWIDLSDRIARYEESEGESDDFVSWEEYKAARIEVDTLRRIVCPCHVTRC